MTLYKNKYRVESARLPGWDYSAASAYFITICTKGREHFFGKVDGGEMILNDIGIIAQDEWLKTPGIRPDMNLELDEFVVMPNHFHAIFFIDANQYNTPVDTQSLRPCPAQQTRNKFGPQTKNVSSVIRGYKSAITRRALCINEHFGWQERFHDHIIRNYDSYIRIRDYIIKNPANWGSDKFYGK